MRCLSAAVAGWRSEACGISGRLSFFATALRVSFFWPLGCFGSDLSDTLTDKSGFTGLRLSTAALAVSPRSAIAIFDSRRVNRVAIQAPLDSICNSAIEVLRHLAPAAECLLIGDASFSGLETGIGSDTGFTRSATLILVLPIPPRDEISSTTSSSSMPIRQTDRLLRH